MYEVQQFHQNRFSAPVDGRVGRHLFWKMGVNKAKELKEFHKLNFEF
jgi:hypothetical protein